MSKFEIKETIGCTKKIHIEVESSRVNKEIDNAVKEVSSTVTIPGFRKGKAPQSMVIKKFGPSIKEEAIKELIPKVIDELFKENSINHVGDPVISDLQLPEDGTLSFIIAVEEIPSINIDGFKGLKITKETRSVSDEDVDGELERLRNRFAKQTEVDRETAKGDIIVANLQKLDFSGVPIIGEKIQKMAFELNGKNTPSPDFDEQVFGMKKNDKKVIKISYQMTEDASGEEKTQQDVYELELLQVYENIIPEIDDDFAKSAGTYNNVDELKTAIRDGLQRRFDYLADEKVQRDIIEEFIKENPFEVPGSMVEKVIKSNIEDTRKRGNNEFNEEEFRANIRPDAVRAVQTFVIVDKIKENMGYTVTREEADERINTLSALYNMKPAEYKRVLIKENRIDEIGNDIIREKVYKWMKEVADIKDKEVTPVSAKSRIVKP